MLTYLHIFYKYLTFFFFLLINAQRSKNSSASKKETDVRPWIILESSRQQIALVRKPTFLNHRTRCSDCCANVHSDKSGYVTSLPGCTRVLVQFIHTLSCLVGMWAQHQMSFYPVLMDKEPAGDHFDQPVSFPTHPYKTSQMEGTFKVCLLDWLKVK